MSNRQTNIQEILKSFNTDKRNEELRRGMIDIKENGYIYKLKEEINNIAVNKNNNLPPQNTSIQNNFNDRQINNNKNISNIGNNMQFINTSNTSNITNDRINKKVEEVGGNSNKNFRQINLEMKNKSENQINQNSDLCDYSLLDGIISEYSQEEKDKKEEIVINKINNNNSSNNKNSYTNNFTNKISDNLSNNLQNNYLINNNINNHINNFQNINNKNQNNYSSILPSILNINKLQNATNPNSNTYTSSLQPTNTITDFAVDDIIDNLDEEDLRNLLGDHEEEDTNQNDYYNINQINNNTGSNNYNINFNNMLQNNNLSRNNNNIERKNNYNNNSNFNSNNKQNNNIINYNNNINNSSNNFNNNLNNNSYNTFNNNIPIPIPNIKKQISFQAGTEDMEINNEGDFIEEYSINTKVANLSQWNGPFPWDELVANANLRVFGYRTFRPNQREIINASLRGRDIFVCMPTGGGKSLTFQIPAIISDGVTIVIMPLLSLIQDQVSSLLGLGVNVIFLNQDGERDLEENFDRYLRKDSDESCKMIFLTPEKISQSNRTKNTLRNLYNRGLIERFVIDEAHCMSQWGREFRPDYLNLKMLRREYPKVPLLAITATAPNKVREDIIQSLGMRDCLFFRSSYNRNNLYIEIRNKKDMSDVVANMANFIKKKYPDSSGLVYCASKKECETISEKLRRDHGLSVHYYHAGMNEKVKNKVQDQWKNDEIRLIVATIAFGMGINKADVRYVIHHAMPKSFENYYQEIGRAGRDGKKSHCLLYYTPSDRRTLEFLMLQNKMNERMIKQNLRKITEMIEYCEEFCECRRVIALLYFDERFDRNDCGKMCDNCRKNLVKEEKDVTKECIKILTLMKNCHNRKIDLTAAQTIDYLKGKKNKNKRYPDGDDNLGGLKDVNPDTLKKMIRRLIIKKFIDEILISSGENKCFSTMVISNEGMDYLIKRNHKDTEKIMITFPKHISKGNYEVEVNQNENPENIDFIDRNFDNKDLNDYNYNISDDIEVLNKLTTANKAKIKLEESKKYERKYNRTKEIEIINTTNEKKNNETISEDDYGYCTPNQFEELLEKLKIKRREILKEENKIIEEENHEKINPNNTHSLKRKITLDEIFPLNGLKELCRKLPTKENELDSNYIFGVGAKFLQKYGKEFLPEIIKHLNVYKIKKNDTNFIDVVNTSIKCSSKKKSIGEFSLFDNPILEEINRTKTENESNNFKKNLNRSYLKEESRNYIESSSNMNKKFDYRLEQASNNIAMFNSMSGQKSEIVIDIKSGVIKAEDSQLLESFMKDLEKCSNENSKNQKVVLNEKSHLSSFLDEIESIGNLDKKGNNNSKGILNKKNNLISEINIFSNNIQNDLYNFNDFEDTNNMENFNEFLVHPNNSEIIRESLNENIEENQEEEEDENENEFSNFAKQVKQLNSGLNKNEKKRRGRDDEDEGVGEKKAKSKNTGNNKGNYFKQKAKWNKINQCKKNKKNNFL